MVEVVKLFLAISAMVTKIIGLVTTKHAIEALKNEGMYIALIMWLAF